MTESEEDNRCDPPYAAPRHVASISECFFYHTIELPTCGVIPGQWDLRGQVDTYLGGVPLANKRVLEVGTANGFLCFEMETRGAEVVGYDLSEEYDWDLVPLGAALTDEEQRARRKHIRKLNNAWWLAHRLLNSQARVAYGSVYEIPRALGTFDICTLGAVLLHLRDPFLALEKVAAMTTDFLVVTELLPASPFVIPLAPLDHAFVRVWGAAVSRLLPHLTLVPRADLARQFDTWWHLSPKAITRFLDILGFSIERITYHRQVYARMEKRPILYTVVGRRRRERTPDEG